MITLLASQTTTATNAGTSSVSMPAASKSIYWQLDVTATATDGVDSLDVYVQTSLDGTKFTDIVHFGQVVGTSNAKRYIAKTIATEPQALYNNASSLATTNQRHVHAELYKARWDIVDADNNCSFTFSIIAIPNT